MGCPDDVLFGHFLAFIFLCASTYIFLKKRRGARTNDGVRHTDSGASPAASNSAGDASYGPANPLSSPAEETSLEASASTATNPGEINLRWRFGPSISLTSPAGSDSAEQEASGLFISPAGSDRAGHRSFSPSNSSTAPEASNSAGDASYGPANPLSSPAEETSLEASASTATNPGEINLCWRFGPSISLTSPAGSDSAEQEASGLFISPAGSDRAGHRSFSPSNSSTAPEASNSAGDASYGPANPLSSPAEETSLEASASTATNPGEINLCWRFGPSISLTSPAGSDSAEQEASGLLISPAGSDRAGHRSFSPSNSSTAPEASNSAGDARYGPANLLNGPDEETGHEASASTATTPAETNIAEHQSFGPSNSSTSPETSTSAEGADSAPANPLSFPEPSNSGEAGLGASSSSTSKTEYNYDIFLSFRGPDTRKGFVDHLYRGLVEVGVMPPDLVFRDEESLHIGDHFPTAIIDAVRHSKISIPVISETYASSKWCLRELIHIMESRRSRGQVVFPILYKVTTDNVRQLTGKFGEAFDLIKEHFDREMVQKVLKEVCSLKVWESENYKHGREAILVKDVIQTVLQEQQKYLELHVSEHLVGTEYHVKEIMRLADTDAFTDTQIIGIHGLGGVGKTTLAKIIYNKFCGKFEHHSFLNNIRNTSKECLQSQLISDLLHHKYDVTRPGFEINTLKSIFEHKKVLILLDDVSHKNQLDNLIKDGSWSKSGSRIIFTSQEEIYLDPAESVVYHGYQLTEMNPDESLILFSRHAFKTNFPPKEFAHLSREIITTTGGLPLSLVVIGENLSTKREEKYWQEMLKELRKSSRTEVQKKLKLSFQTLEDREQEIFLDIACLFDGTDARIATYMWDGCELCTTMGIDKLKSLSLIKIGDNNELGMQGQLRDLGRSIASQNGSRIWDFEEALKILDNPEGATKIVALHLDKNGSSKLFKQRGLRSLPKLRFLHASSEKFLQHLRKAFSELRWLRWERCPDSFKPTNIGLEKLLILELSSSTCENWGGWRSIKMKELKVLNLSRCSRLKSTPDLSAFESLEFLILEHCEDLEKIDPSIGKVQGLISLNLRWCGSLEKLPEEVGKLENLEELLLDETDIQEIPPCIGSLKKLKMLSAVGCCSLTEIPSSIGSLVKLSTLDLATCKRLPELLDSVQSLVELKRLSLVRCYMLKRIPSMIGKLKLLTELDLSYTGVMELPESIEELQNLEILRFSRSAVEKLPSAVGRLGKLQELVASGCHKLKEDICIDTSGLSSLKILHLGRARISRLPDIDELSTLEHLDLLYCDRLELLPKLPSGLSLLQLTCQSSTLPSLYHLSYLKELTLHVCMSLESIPKLPSRLRKLRVWKCHKLKTLPDLSNLEFLSKLELLQCYSLMGIEGLKALKSLRTLDVSTGTELSDLDDFEDLESVRYFDLESHNGEEKYIELEGLDELECLEVLNISARKSITKLDLSKSESLKRLIARNCESLAEIQGPNKLELLEELDISGCKSIVTLPDFSACKKLRILEVKYCEKLTEPQGLKPGFTFDRTGCKSMEQFQEDQ